MPETGMLKNRGPAPAGGNDFTGTLDEKVPKSAARIWPDRDGGGASPGQPLKLFY